MGRRSAWLLAAALAFAGCGERHAGTETGNPEITVSARFMLSEYGNSYTTHLPFLVMGMGYSIATPSGAPDSGKCWMRPGGTLANLADFSLQPLPDTSIEDKGPWPQAEIILRTPEGPAGVPDTADIETWSSPRYAKFTWVSAGRYHRVLFEMPQGAEYRLRYGLASTEMWRFPDSILIPFAFNATMWTDTLAAVRRLVTRLDGRNEPYLLFSPTENAAGWKALAAQLPKSFYADSLVVR